VASAIAHFITFEMFVVNPSGWLGPFTAFRHRAMIAMGWMEMVIYMPSES
jgi:hypothetical protein